MAAATVGPIWTEECGTCKSPTKEKDRALCAICLNRTLQRACENIVVFKAPAPQQRFCRGPTPRALFPGMPRAVLGPVISKGHRISSSPPCCLSETASASNSPVPSFGVRTPVIKEAEPPVRRDALMDRLGQNIELAEETTAEGRGLAGGEEQGKFFLPGIVGAEEGGGEEKAAVEKGVDKWHVFPIEKNLKVRIPNPPVDISIRPLGRSHLFVVPPKEKSRHTVPPRKEARPKQGLRFSDVKKSSIKPNFDAEAELMTRLLAGSMPILKSTAPLILPPCKVRPAPVFPVSQPGDPLWKRRSITCPRSLKVQAPPICVS